MRISLLTVPTVRKVKQGMEPLVKVVSELVNFLLCHEALLVHPLGREGWTAWCAQSVLAVTLQPSPSLPHRLSPPSARQFDSDLHTELMLL